MAIVTRFCCLIFFTELSVKHKDFLIINNFSQILPLDTKAHRGY